MTLYVMVQTHMEVHAPRLGELCSLTDVNWAISLQLCMQTNSYEVVIICSYILKQKTMLKARKANGLVQTSTTLLTP